MNLYRGTQISINVYHRVKEAESKPQRKIAKVSKVTWIIILVKAGKGAGGQYPDKNYTSFQDLPAFSWQGVCFQSTKLYFCIL